MQYVKVGRNFAMVDDEDYDYVSKYEWKLEPTPTTFHAVAKILDRNVKMHELITNKRGTEHYNGNGLDNRRINLRVTWEVPVPRAKQQRNRSGYKGVSFVTTRNQWQAQIRFNFKMMFIGRYETAEEAARAYDEKAKELFGEKAKLNFPLAGAT